MPDGLELLAALSIMDAAAALIRANRDLRPLDQHRAVRMLCR